MGKILIQILDMRQELTEIKKELQAIRKCLELRPKDAQKSHSRIIRENGVVKRVEPIR